MNLRPKGRIITEFSASSMTDVIFLLLIFFIIISSVVKDPALKVVLPKGVKTRVKDKVVRVYIDENLNYAVDNKKVSYERLPSELRSALTNNPGATVSIHGDKEIRYDDVMSIVLMADKMDAKVVLALAKE